MSGFNARSSWRSWLFVLSKAAMVWTSFSDRSSNVWFSARKASNSLRFSVIRSDNQARPILDFQPLFVENIPHHT